MICYKSPNKFLPLKRQSQLQQTTNFDTSFRTFEKNSLWFSWNIMPYLLFLKKRQHFKLSSVAIYRWRFKDVTFPLVSWVRCGTWLYRFLIFALLLTLMYISNIFSAMHLHYGDLTDSTCLVKIISQIRPTEIYNLAAQSHVKVRSLSLLTLNAPITTKVDSFSRMLKCLRSLYGKQCGPRSDCSCRSSLIWVHAVCFYT